jgi:hypothetical protein
VKGHRSKASRRREKVSLTKKLGSKNGGTNETKEEKAGYHGLHQLYSIKG